MFINPFYICKFANFFNVSAKDGVVKKNIYGYEGNIFPTHITSRFLPLIRHNDRIHYEFHYGRLL